MVPTGGRPGRCIGTSQIDAEVVRRAFAEDCELTAAVYFALARELMRRLTTTQEMLLDLQT